MRYVTNKLIICILFVLIQISQLSFGQDSQFSQFFANPLNLNPAFTGTTQFPRAIINFRNQWPQKNGTYTTYTMSVDGFIEKMNGGLGFQFLHDRELNNIINTSAAAFSYSYHIKIDNFSYVTAALQAGIVYKQLSTGTLVFPGMINQLTGEISGNLPAGFENASKMFPDFAVGAAGQSNDFFWGACVHHLNHPDESLVVGDQKGRLPLKFTLHLGARSHNFHRGLLSKEFTVSPNILYQQQGSFKQLNLGIYMIEKSITFGGWYRNNLSVRPDALIALIGFSKDKFQFGYSFDLTLSNLASMSYGSHEISLTFFFGDPEKYRYRESMQIPPI